MVRPCLTHTDLLVENGLSRLKPKSGFLTQSKKGFFDAFLTHPFRLSFLTWGSSGKTQLKKFLHLFFERISSLIPPQNTHPHAHTPIPGTTQQYHTTAPTLAWQSLLMLLAASQHGALLAPLASSVYHTTAAARVIVAILPTTATPAVALAAFG